MFTKSENSSGKRQTINTCSHTWLPNALVLAVCSPFLLSAIGKAMNMDQAMIEYEKLGIALPMLAVLMTILVQLAGTALLLIGRGRWALAGGVLLALFTMAATFIGHAFWRLDGSERQAQLNVFVEHIAIASALILSGWWRKDMDRHH